MSQCVLRVFYNDLRFIRSSKTLHSNGRQVVTYLTRRMSLLLLAVAMSQDTGLTAEFATRSGTEVRSISSHGEVVLWDLLTRDIVVLDTREGETEIPISGGKRRRYWPACCGRRHLGCRKRGIASWPTSYRRFCRWA